MRSIAFSLVLLGAAAVAGCNEGARPLASAPGGPVVAPAQFVTPGGSSACAVELSRFQGVLKADLDTGNVNQSVYDQIERDLGGAARACQAGRDGEAIGIIRATKARHGYRPGA